MTTLVHHGSIGVFDSGLGGLLILHSLTSALPQYDYIYLGDVKHMPYGNRSREQVYRYSLAAVEYLFAQGCELIIIACNTASAEALRRLQQEYLPNKYPDRRILGVLIPAAEAAIDATRTGRIGVVATSGTVRAGTFSIELAKAERSPVVYEQAAPLLVPLIEYRGDEWLPAVVAAYLRPLIAAKIDTLILGCTHYPVIKALVREQLGAAVTVITQDEIVPRKLIAYLARHPELEARLGRHGYRRFDVTDVTEGGTSLAHTLYGREIALRRVEHLSGD